MKVKADYHLLAKNIINPNLDELLQISVRNWNRIEPKSLLDSRDLQDRSRVYNQMCRLDLSLNSIISYMECTKVNERRKHVWVENFMDGQPNVSNLYEELKVLSRSLVDSMKELKTGASMYVFFSLIKVHSKAERQYEHQDNPEGNYWTAMFPITRHSKQGGTQFRNGGLPPKNSAYYFNGKVLHYGTENQSDRPRYALMAVVVSEKDEPDANRSLVDIPFVVQVEDTRGGIPSFSSVPQSRHSLPSSSPVVPSSRRSLPSRPLSSRRSLPSRRPTGPSPRRPAVPSSVVPSRCSTPSRPCSTRSRPFIARGLAARKGGGEWRERRERGTAGGRENEEPREKRERGKAESEERRERRTAGEKRTAGKKRTDVNQ